MMTGSLGQAAQLAALFTELKRAGGDLIVDFL